MCERRISTENGVLTCDLPKGHDGHHHAIHAGGFVAFPDQHKDESNQSPIRNEKGEAIAGHHVEPLEIEWPQEAPLQHVLRNENTNAAKERAVAKAALGPGA